MKQRAILAAAAAVLLGVGSANANPTLISVGADFEDYGTIVHPRFDIFGFVNESDAGVQITSITIDMTNSDSNADTYPLDPSPHVPVFDSEPGCTDYCYGEELGYPVTGFEPGATNVGLVTPTAAEQAAWEENQIVTLNFTDWDPGETFFFNADLDDTFDFRVSGREFAFSTLSVTAVGQGLPADGRTVTSNYGGDPENFWRAVTRAEESFILCGDFDENGVLNTNDARLIQRCVVGEIECSKFCDVDNNNICNTTDARLIQLFVVGIVDQAELSCSGDVN